MKVMDSERIFRIRLPSAAGSTSAQAVGSLPANIPDLPDRYAQKAAQDEANARAAKDKAQSALSYVKYTPLAFAVPVFRWWIENNPGRSADGRGEAEFHYYTPRHLPFDASQWQWDNGRLYYWTKRNDRFCDIAASFNGKNPRKGPDGIWYFDLEWSGYLYREQSEEFRSILTWRVKLWEDTELPANVCLLVPKSWEQGLRNVYGVVSPEEVAAIKAAKDAATLAAAKAQIAANVRKAALLAEAKAQIAANIRTANAIEGEKTARKFAIAALVISGAAIAYKYAK